MEELFGKTFVQITRGNDDDGDYIMFVTKDDEHYKMYHSQDCCESVWLEDIVGELDDLLGQPIIVSEEVTNREDPPISQNYPEDWGTPESYTWTYYNLATPLGSVQIRWFGSSNGYYSEEATIRKVK